jgi:hypothetical protein
MKEWIYFALVLIMLALMTYCSLQAQEPCDVYNYFEKTEYKQVADVIAKVSILESNWFKNGKHIEFNNYFSVKDRKDTRCLTKPIYCLQKFDSFEDSLPFMLGYFRKRKYPKDRKGFIEKLKEYAEDPNYVEKVLKIKINCRK